MNKIDEEGEYLLRKTLKEFLRLNEHYPPEKVSHWMELPESPEMR